MVGHDKKLIQRQNETTAVRTATQTQTSFVRQTAQRLEGQIGQTQTQYDMFLRNLAAPPESVQVPGAKADQESLGR